MATGLKDLLIKKVVHVMVKRANDSFDMQELLEKYSADGRSMAILITDISDGFGFNIADGQMVMDAIEKPTCVVSMDKKTFSAVVTGKVTQSQAFLMDSLQITGDNWLRDSIVLSKIFDELKDTMLKRG
jgi:putative sterol carrier protein